MPKGVVRLFYNMHQKDHLSAVKPDDKIYPTEILLKTDITGLPKQSIAMVQQMRTVSHHRLLDLAETIKDPVAQKEILDACRNYFEL